MWLTPNTSFQEPLKLRLHLAVNLNVDSAFTDVTH